MKRLITLLMIMLLLAGCSGKKNNEQSSTSIPEETSIKPVSDDPLAEFYGTWRTSAIYTNGARFDMEQIEALGGSDSFDAIFIINKDGNVIAYSPYYGQTEEEWVKGDNSESIIFGDSEFVIEDNEMVMTADGEKLYLAKISDRQDKEFLDELLETEKSDEETKQVEEPEQETKEESNVSDNTIRPDVKEAIDAYEAFVDEYCEFMKKYSESNGTDLSILKDYVTFMSKLEDYTNKMDEMEDDLTDAEYWYYVDVLNRCNEKMLRAAS